MNKFLSFIIAALLCIFNAPGTQAASTELFDWGFHVDGTTYCLLGPCDFDVEDRGNIDGPEDLPAFIDASGFDFAMGLGSVSITLSEPGSHSVVMFVDHDIDEPLNDFINERGFTNGNPEMGQTWEIDEPGYGTDQNGSSGFPYFGDIFFDNFLIGMPDNRAFYDAIDDQTLTPPDDVSMAMGWDFELVEGESAAVVFLLSDTSVPQGFHLVHRDPDSDVNIYFSSSVVTEQASGPEVSIPSRTPAVPGGTVTVPVNFSADGNEISSTVFSVDYDENFLSFDPADGDGDGIPDSITFNVTSAFISNASFNQADTDGEIDISLFSFSDTLPDGLIVSITFTAGNAGSETEAAVSFSLDPPASYGDTLGQDVPGSSVNGSVLITPDGETDCFDGEDNDGDGSTDCADPDCEGATNGSCDTGLSGICSTGITTCQSETSVCVPDNEAEPDDATCDGSDNDCDGQIDEDFQATPTTCGRGACEDNRGQIECQNGSEVDTCDPFAGAAPDDATCNNVDDDCDGSTDEDFQTRPTTCGEGECEGNTGQVECKDGSEVDTCDPLAGATAEICDNLDNDCDGSTDENLSRPTTCGVGECAGNSGEETCTAGTWGGDTCDPLAGAMTEGPPGNVTCNDMLDNDCDGLVDSDDRNCEMVGGDVSLVKLKAPESITIRTGKTKRKKIRAFALADTIAQKATVDLTVNRIDAVTVNIHRARRTRSVEPVDDPRKFKFLANITCNETGTWVLQWKATIDAQQNGDTSNDTMTASTTVTCKKEAHQGGWQKPYIWKLKSFIWTFFKYYFG